jgi:undecaprenyl-diphosphatase
VFDAEVLKLWIEQNPNWISFSFFFIAFFESFAGLGLFMPGVILLAAAAGLANLYNINPFEILIYGYIGACSADILSFLIGNFFRNKIDSIWPFSSYPEALSKGRSFFEKYGIYKEDLVKYGLSQDELDKMKELFLIEQSGPFYQ